MNKNVVSRSFSLSLSLSLALKVSSFVTKSVFRVFVYTIRKTAKRSLRLFRLSAPNNKLVYSSVKRRRLSFVVISSEVKTKDVEHWLSRATCSEDQYLS